MIGTLNKVEKRGDMGVVIGKEIRMATLCSLTVTAEEPAMLSGPPPRISNIPSHFLRER
ncbi:conserved hypothetical protein [Ricinus communis]|uniref:Uncharacterized protein n=1 Tax=Ricinus communis TaxID=3988 RepID=B9RGV7_RICCO|nr:conserved hypothetical protein [Ricinus communis]